MAPQEAATQILRCLREGGYSLVMTAELEALRGDVKNLPKKTADAILLRLGLAK